ASFHLRSSRASIGAFQKPMRHEDYGNFSVANSATGVAGAAPKLSPVMPHFDQFSGRPQPRGGGSAEVKRSGVDLYELGMGPLDGVLGRHPLNGLGIHIDDDELRDG